MSVPSAMQIRAVEITSSANLYVDTMSVYGIRVSACGPTPTHSFTCVSCSNSVVDGSESDTDCGGSCATKCSVDKKCNSDSDCATGRCTNPPAHFSEWTVGLSNNGGQNLDAAAFNAAFQASPTHIIRYECETCAPSHRNIYYKRITDPTSFEPYDYMCCNWFNNNNVLGTDFQLYSTIDDAVADTNRWAFCNYNDGGIGFPRDCGPTGYRAFQWFAKHRLPRRTRLATFSIHIAPQGTCTDPSPRATCNNGVRDFLETDVDCGGTACATVGKLCASGQTCTVDSDCSLSGSCGATGVCSNCNDGIRNGDESDVDCGGACDKCSAGQTCIQGLDCADNLFCYTADAAGAVTAGRGSEIQWTQVVSNDGSSQIDWANLCRLLPDLTERTVIKTTTLSSSGAQILDYFRPVSTMSACEFFLSSDKHLWSSDRSGPFARPQYHDSSGGQVAYGGSRAGSRPVGSCLNPPCWGDASDTRDTLPFWGAQSTPGQPTRKGACLNCSTCCGKPVTVEVSTPGTCAGRATVDMASNSTTATVPPGMSACPTFLVGDGTGGTEIRLADVSSTAACVALVQQQQPTANGVTTSYPAQGNSIACYAEFGATGTTGPGSSWQTCLLQGNSTLRLENGAALLGAMWIRSSPPAGLSASVSQFTCSVEVEMRANRGVMLSFPTGTATCAMSTSITQVTESNVLLRGDVSCINEYLARFRAESTCATPWDDSGAWWDGSDDETEVQISARITGSASCDVATGSTQLAVQTVAVTLFGRPVMAVAGNVKHASCVTCTQASTCGCHRSGATGVRVHGLVQSRCNALDVGAYDNFTVWHQSIWNQAVTNFSASDGGSFIIYLPFTPYLARSNGTATLNFTKDGLATSQVTVTLKSGTVNVGNVFMVSGGAADATVQGFCGNARFPDSSTQPQTAFLRPGLYASANDNAIAEVDLVQYVYSGGQWVAGSGSGAKQMKYTFERVPPGVYTMTCQGDDLFNASTHVISNGPTCDSTLVATVQTNCTPALAQTALTPPTIDGGSNELTAVMTWDPSWECRNNPGSRNCDRSEWTAGTTTDMDIHLQFNARDSTVENNGDCHVYYGNLVCGTASLDRDNVQGGQYGGETIFFGNVYSTIYTAYVRCYSCYSQNKALEDTGMTVKVYSGLGQIEEVHIPPPTPENYNTWTTAPDGTFQGVDFIRLFCVDATATPPAVHPALRYFRRGTAGSAMACSTCPCESPPTIIVQPPPPPPPMPWLYDPAISDWSAGLPSDVAVGRGSLANRGDFVMLRFTGVPSARYTFECLVDRSTGFSDSKMAMYRTSDNRRVRYNDDRYRRTSPSGQYYGSSFTYRMPSSSSASDLEYTIKVWAYGNAQTGSFVVTVNRPSSVSVGAVLN
jgi:hypothetical protein